MIVFAKQLIISIHQLALTDGGCRLLRGNIGGTFSESQFSDTHTDRTGGDQHDLISRVLEVAQHSAKLLHAADIQKSRRIGKSRGSDFYDNSHSINSLVF